jgi:hypothetical protein
MPDEINANMKSIEQSKPINQMNIEELKLFELRLKAALFDLGEKIQINRNSLYVIQTEIENREKKV